MSDNGSSFSKDTSLPLGGPGRDNIAAWIIGVGQVFLGMLNQWLSELLGYEKLAGLGAIGLIAVLGVLLLFRLDRKDRNSFTTMIGLSGVAVAMVFVGGSSRVPSSAEELRQLQTVIGEVFVDRNQNGFRDGTDEQILGVEVILRDETGQQQSRLSDARGYVSFSIPKSRSSIKVTACGIAQSHTLSAIEEIAQPPKSGGIESPRVYKIDIGIERADWSACRRE